MSQMTPHQEWIRNQLKASLGAFILIFEDDFCEHLEKIMTEIKSEILSRNLKPLQ